MYKVGGARTFADDTGNNVQGVYEGNTLKKCFNEEIYPACKWTQKSVTLTAPSSLGTYTYTVKVRAVGYLPGTDICDYIEGENWLEGRKGWDESKSCSIEVVECFI